MDFNAIGVRVLYLIPLILSLTVHEFAHAWAAFRLGDDTAQRAGRLTLNPLVHIDPLGTFLLPLMGIPFGWARPVPVVPSRFRQDVNMTTGMMITAAAGPGSNVLIAIISAVVFGLTARWSPSTLQSIPALSTLLEVTLEMNVALAIFNMLPIPPLDGSRVLEGILPDRWRPHWERVTALGPILLIAAVVFGGRLISGPARMANALLYKLLETLAG